jgi:glycosyltransferase involved in cell wall biosynthesis
MNIKTVLVIGYVWPEPHSSAAGCHMLSLLRTFRQQDWRVIFATPAQETDHMVDLSLESIESQKITLNDSAFDEWLKQINPDLVMFDRFLMEEQFGWRVTKHCPQALKLLDTEDLQFLRYARHQALKDNVKLNKNYLLSERAKREVAAIFRSDLSLIISDYETHLLQETFSVDASLLHHLPFLLDLSKLPDSFKAFEERQHFITIGNFRHEPNWDSVLYLQKIWPEIRKQLPDAELHIYGAYPPKKATQLNNPKTGFLIKGWAEDAFEVLANARVCLAPLRFGAGIKGKLIDAMQVGTPSVTTDIGCEGMHGELAWPGLVANTSQAIAEAAVNLYQNKSLWLNSQQACVPLLQESYDSKKLSTQLIEKIIATKNNLSEHRLNNFTGAMLNHHSMRSTEYMAKWIEAKNKS